MKKEKILKPRIIGGKSCPCCQRSMKTADENKKIFDKLLKRHLAKGDAKMEGA